VTLRHIRERNNSDGECGPSVAFSPEGGLKQRCVTIEAHAGAASNDASPPVRYLQL
jgi:hypothetical protein